jgi:hypothetical protein
MTPDNDGPPVKPALQPKADKPLYESPGNRDKKEQTEKIGKEAGGKKEHPAEKDHGTVQQLASGKSSLYKFRPNATEEMEPLGADQPSPCQTYGEQQKDRRERTDQLSHFYDEV